MKDRDEILKQNLREQIALEEQLSHLLEAQLAEIDPIHFPDAASLLQHTREVIEGQFAPLNDLLEKLESETSEVKTQAIMSNGHLGKGQVEIEQGARRSARISRMLRDDYSVLNLITISNTLLHTMALALKREEIAALALQHLENLAPFVVKIGELMPEIVTRELNAYSPLDDLSVAKKALQNTKLAWHRSPV